MCPRGATNTFLEVHYRSPECKKEQLSCTFSGLHDRLPNHEHVLTKAELLQEGIFFLIHLFARDIFVMKNLEIEKSKPTVIISVLKVEH